MKAKKIALILTGAILAGTLSMTGCGQSAGAGASGAEQVIIYSNADESVAVVDKGGDTNPLAQEMAECIITQGRSELQKYYPNAVYEGETTDEANSSAYPKVFPEPLTLDLLEKHQELSESCK